MDIARFAVAIVLMAALGVATQALAQPTSAPASRPTTGTLAISELTERLSREGYRDIREIKLKSDKLYKVTARDAQGRTREMEIDARTAEILTSEDDDDDK